MTQEGHTSTYSTRRRFDCSARLDGFYSIGCTSEFVFCINKHTIFMTCPSSLVFNAKGKYCDYPDKCSKEEGAHAYSPLLKDSLHRIKSSRSNFVCPKPNGAFSNGCLPNFYICVNNEPRLMACPAHLVFNAAEGFCDHKKNCNDNMMATEPYNVELGVHIEPLLPNNAGSSECSYLPDGLYGLPCVSKFMNCAGGVSYSINCPKNLVFEPEQGHCVSRENCKSGQSFDSSVVAYSSSITAENDCALMSDGLHSLGCIAEFLQCVDGKAYSLYCPAGLVYVEEMGRCDVPSSCSAQRKSDDNIGPMPYFPVINKDGKAEYAPECFEDGYFSQHCSPNYFNCVGGKKFIGKCPNGLIFDLDKAVCDHPNNCVQGEGFTSVDEQPVPTTVANKDNSCEGRPDGVVADTDCRNHFTTCLSYISYITVCPAGLVYSLTNKMCDYPEACGKRPITDDLGKTVITKKTSLMTSDPTSAFVGYQDSVVGKDLCTGKEDGPLTSVDCRQTFSFCVNGAIYSINCLDGLLYSFVNRRCEPASECGNFTATAHSVELPQYENMTSAHPPSTYHSLLLSVNDIDCSSRNDGRYALGCVGRFVICSHGRSYIGTCPSNLLYNAERGRCDHECVSAYNTLNDFVQDSPQYFSTRGKWPSQGTSSVECVISVGLGTCSSMFWRCRNGKLESAQCPGSSRFDESLALCVYDLPECTYIPTSTAYAVEDETMLYSASTHLPTSRDEIIFATSASPVKYPSGHASAAASYQASPFIPYPSHGPLQFHDWMQREDHVNRGLIQFENRSVLADGSSRGVNDIFDGKKSPWLHPGINRIFVPNHHRYHARSHDNIFQNEMDMSNLFDMPDPELSVPVEVKLNQEPIPALLQAQEESGLLKVSKPDRFSDIEEEIDESDTEGSGEEEFIRRRRSSFTYNTASTDFSMCTSPHTPGLVSLGFCHEDFIFCKAEGDGVVAACPVGDLFESKSMKCVVSQKCGQSEANVAGAPQTRSEVTKRKYSVPPSYTGTPSRKFTSTSPPRDTTAVPRKAVLVQRDLVTTARDAWASTGKAVAAYPPLVASAALESGFAEDSQEEVQRCSDGVDFAADCVGNFIKCGHGVVYSMKCPDGLVFNKKTHACDYPAAVAECNSTASSHHSQPDSFSPVISQNTPRRDGLDPSPQSTKRMPTEESDICAYLRDGPYSEGCTSAFLICLDRRIYSSVNCPLGTWFDQKRGICDFREKVPACSGLMEEPFSKSYQHGVLQTKASNSADSSCSSTPTIVAPCSAAYSICSNGEKIEYICAKPLVFNPKTSSCDFREYVLECEEYKPNSAVSHDNGERTSEAPSTVTALPCVYSEERPAFALQYCGRVYGMCSSEGILQREECDVGFLFDPHVVTCVHAEQCGQYRLNELLTQLTATRPLAAPFITQDKPRGELRRESDRCRNSAEGSMKPLGRCRSSYIRCEGGEAMIKQCSTTAEVFSVALSACVLRISAPECHMRQAPHELSQPQKPSLNDHPSLFCRSRSDGLYMNPTNCSGILQCFGGDVYEYPSCASGLAFNERTSKCDYKDSVPECQKLASEKQKAERDCEDAEHGDFIEHKLDCRQFYRCVWGHRISMRCPSGTVFNPKLSVCDWPAYVPQCSFNKKALQASTIENLLL